MLVGIGTVTALWLWVPEAVAWPWYVPIGTAITSLIGWGLGKGREAVPRGSG